MDEDTGDNRSDGPAAARRRTIYLLKNADLAVRSLAEPLLRGAGLTLAQYTVLSVVEMRENISSAALARRLGMTPQSANEVIIALAREGLVERIADPDHGRIRLISVTRAGRDRLRSSDVLIDHVEQTLLTGISEQSLEILRTTLATISQNWRQSIKPQD